MCKIVPKMLKINRYTAIYRLLVWVLLQLMIFEYLQSVSAFETKTTFNGSQYIEYPLPSHEDGSTMDRILLSFKTAEPYGVLLYSGGTQGDFFALEIIRGKLR